MFTGSSFTCSPLLGVFVMEAVEIVRGVVGFIAMGAFIFGFDFDNNAKEEEAFGCGLKALCGPESAGPVGMFGKPLPKSALNWNDELGSSCGAAV
mmetsp:Transcript_1273/g.2793  ORF Transcript_1273/g.2793 Transcript_1273/m.2793 type:complete len:95 (-) Transcript_1273:1021-1305(-)